MQTVIYILFAAIALGLLVFIHEWGHYWVARRVGMKVEVFSIGFGKPVKQWLRGDVRWQLGWLPFGGYVKIAGMEMGKRDAGQEGEREDGFFAKRPFDRIKVALAGPLVNILFALLVFSVIWLCGGRQKPFSEFTQYIGWVDPDSKMYTEGVRPGDELLKYNNHPYTNSKDLLFAAMMGGEKVKLEGIHFEKLGGRAIPYETTVEPYHVPGAPEGYKTIGIASPARYLIYDEANKTNDLAESSPVQGSGLQYGDRLLWMNGDVLYSLEQMSALINQPRALLTVVRQDKTLLLRAPRVKVGEMRFDVDHREELSDWQHEMGLKSKLPYLYFLPYNLNQDGVVESALSFIDREAQEEAFPKATLSPRLDAPLLPGDKIIAVNGTPVKHTREILSELQQPKVLMIVQRGLSYTTQESWKVADQAFEQLLRPDDLQTIALSIGTDKLVTKAGNYVLLQPVVPKTLLDFNLSAEKKGWLMTELLEQRKEIEGLHDADKRLKALQAFEEGQKRLMLGIYLQDRKVVYNPQPLVLFENILEESWHTLTALFSGHLSPKWISGPVGIVRVMQQGWMIGPMEALFWIGAISLNLAILNLLPLPVLDGGYILFSLIEVFTGRALKARTLEKIILPFMILLIAFILFVTYHDLLRLF